MVGTSALEVEEDCPFCEIVQRDDPDVREIYRDAGVVAFSPTEPAALGHTLIVPKSHIADIWGLDNRATCDLAIGITKLAWAIKRAVHPDGLNVIQSNGEAATQTVMHVHFHLVPRWYGDKIGRIWPPETNYSEGQKDVVYDAIRNALQTDPQLDP